MSRLLGFLACAGELLVLAGAVSWLPAPQWGEWLFVVGTLFFAVGRLLGKEGDYAQSVRLASSVRVRRLYRQRILGVVMLVLATAALCHGAGFVAGYYLGRSAWLIPFMVFVVIELYTAFRLPKEE